MDLLKRAGRSSNLASGHWLRGGVVVLEVALAFVLLVGSGLMVRSFIALQRAQPGYEPNGVLTFLLPNLPIPDDQARQAFVRDLRARLSALPGVTGVTAATPLPLDPRESLARYGTEEALVDPTKFGQATVHFVQPGYFDVMRTRVIEGRTFTEDDNREDVRDVVIDRVLAGRVFAGQSAVGRTLLVAAANAGARAVQGDRRRRAPASRLAGARWPRGSVHRRGPGGIRYREPVGRCATSGDPSALSTSVRAVVSSINPRVGVIDVQPMLAFVGRAQAQTKFALVLIGSSPASRWSWRRSGSTACCRPPSVSGRRRSACAWRSGPSTAGSSA